MPWGPIAAKIVDKGGDYLLSIKGNQGRLHDEVRNQFAFALRQLDPAKLDSQRWSHAQTQDTGHDCSKTRYYMSSLKGVRAAELLGYIRGHWSIENRCHWVLDAIYREDHKPTRDRQSAANHSTLRRMALNAHNQMPFEGKKRKSRHKREPRVTSDESYLEQLLSLL